MTPERPAFRDRLEAVRDRIARAAIRAGRRPDEVRLVAVVKTVPAQAVLEAVAEGLLDLGESRVQEAERKIGEVGRHRARWHLVGHLQRNKVGRAVSLFDRIHSLDRAELAEVLSRKASEAGLVLPVLVQVNVSGEPAKHGVAPDSLERLLEAVAELPGLKIDGLMSIGHLEARGPQARSEFAHTRTMRDAAERALGVRLPELSMGMSGDFEAAIEEGSTMVRLGTVLFGSRPAD